LHPPYFARDILHPRVMRECDEMLIRPIVLNVSDVSDEKYKWRFRESCYHLSPEKKDQHDAVTYCNSLGAKLITIETMDEFEYIRMRLESSGLY